MLPIPRSVPVSLRTENCKCDLSDKHNPIARLLASSLTLREVEKYMVLPEVLLCPLAMRHDCSSRSSSLPLSIAGASHASPFSACSARSTTCRSQGLQSAACLHGHHDLTLCRTARTKPRSTLGKKSMVGMKSTI